MKLLTILGNAKIGAHMKTAYFFYVYHFAFGGISLCFFSFIYLFNSNSKHFWNQQNDICETFIITHDIRIHFLCSIANCHIRLACYLLVAKLAYILVIG